MLVLVLAVVSIVPPCPRCHSVLQPQRDPGPPDDVGGYAALPLVMAVLPAQGEMRASGAEPERRLSRPPYRRDQLGETRSSTRFLRRGDAVLERPLKRSQVRQATV